MNFLFSFQIKIMMTGFLISRASVVMACDQQIKGLTCLIFCSLSSSSLRAMIALLNWFNLWCYLLNDGCSLHGWNSFFNPVNAVRNKAKQIASILLKGLIPAGNNQIFNHVWMCRCVVCVCVCKQTIMLMFH